MDVAGNACAACLTQVEAEVHARRPVNSAQDSLHALGQCHHLLRILGRERGQRIDMEVRDDEDVAGGVGKGVEAQKAGLCADQNVRCHLCLGDRHPVGNGVVHGSNQVAEDAAAIHGAGLRPRAERGGHAGAGGGFIGAGDILIAPRCPQSFHAPEYSWFVEDWRRIRSRRLMPGSDSAARKGHFRDCVSRVKDKRNAGRAGRFRCA